jgi:hypothetical protein
MNSRTASATSWTAIAVSSKPEIRVTSSMPGWPSTRLTTPANRSVSHSTTSTTSERDPDPLGRRARLAHEHHDRRDRARPSQQRRTERHEGDVDLAVAGQPLDLAAKQVKSDHQQQQQTPGGLQAREPDPQVKQYLLAEQGEDPDDQRGHQDRLPRCPMALARLVTISQRQEQRDGGDRVDDHDQSDETLDQ